MATGESKVTALENALLKSGLLEIYLFVQFELQEKLRDSEPEEIQQIAEKFACLNKFLTESFSELLLYRFCFWDYEHLYILGETGDRDRVGICLHSQFTYNP